MNDAEYNETNELLRSDTSKDSVLYTQNTEVGTNEEDTDQDRDEMIPSDPDVPSELLKVYYCGCGPCHPNWLQWFAKKKIFTLLLSLFAFLEGAVVSGLTSVILSTIEKRYKFTGTIVGIIPASYDITITSCIIFISYFGGKSHKPKWLGISLIIMGIGALVFASPQFFLGRYDVGSSSGNFLFETCFDQRNFTSDCSPSNNAAFVLFISGKFLIAIGAAPLFTVGQAYLDEIVHPRYISIHLGVYYTMNVFGPVFGYVLGSSCLSVYVDPWVDTTLKTTDPAWVGAWWIPFVLCGFLSLIVAVPFLMFPRYLPDSYLIRQERIKEMAKTYSNRYVNEDLKSMVRMLPIHLKRLLLNPSFLFVSFGLAGMFIIASGMVVFAPQYIEYQFHLTATVAGLLSGGIGVTTAVFGVMSGALIVHFVKLKGKGITIFVGITSIIIIPAICGLLLHCPSFKIAGITTTYPNSSTIGFDDTPCVDGCHCSSHVFEPVCGADDLTYFSPCRAGCMNTNNNDGTYSFSNCTCVAEGLLNGTNTTIAQLPFSDILHKYSTATSGECSETCHLLIPFMFGIIIITMLLFMSQIPIAYFTLRVVADDQRSLASGVQSAIWRLFGSIPGPIIFGAIFDASCLKWQGECGHRGNCWVYDNSTLSLVSIAVSIPIMCLVSVVFFLARLTYPKQQKEYIVNENERKTDDISQELKMRAGFDYIKKKWFVKFSKHSSLKNEDESSL